MALCVSANAASQELGKRKKSIECVNYVELYNVVVDTLIKCYIR